MKINDIVSRKSYKNDIWFRIVDIQEDNVILQGLNVRLIADANINDLEKINMRNSSNEINSSSINLFKNWYMKQCGIYSTNDNYIDSNEITKYNNSIGEKYYKKFGKVLHIDGDRSYLYECLAKYNELGVHAIGVSIEEYKQPEMILDLLKTHKPNIIVITGHDSIIRGEYDLNNIDNYKNSKYYIESVKIAREYNSNYDDLVIFAGGCKSHYEGLMNAGANYAASPSRVLIQVIDPVIVACKIAMTSVRDFLDIDSAVRETSVGLKGIGGIETRGQSREYKPKV